MSSVAKSLSPEGPCIAILLAGGSSSRFGNQLPKQFVPLKDRPVFHYALNTFNACSRIDEILLVIPSTILPNTAALINRSRWNKLIQPFVLGGKRRCDSCYNALNKLRDYPQNSTVLVHDVARPLVSDILITRVIAALARGSAVSAAIPIIDTLAEAEEGRLISIVPRARYHQLQTPQGFSLQLLLAAYQDFYATAARRESLLEPTDDCSIVRSYDESISITLAQGEVSNIKLTHPEDMQLIESFL